MRHLCETSEDYAIWEVQLAFLRREDAANRRGRRLTQRKYHRHRKEIRTLCWQLSDAGEGILRAHPAWSELTKESRQSLIVMMERVIRHGRPIPIDEAATACGFAISNWSIPMQPYDAEVGRQMLESLVEAELVAYNRRGDGVAPVCIPLALFGRFG